MSLEEAQNKDFLYAQKACMSIDRLNALISELLDVSKIQEGKLNMQISSFDCNDMLDAAIESVQITSPTHQIIKPDEMHQIIKGDKERLQQVVINLLTNAIKYSPGTDKVFVNVELQNGNVKFSVTDTGIGFRKENRNRIFERYYREDERAIHFQGLGIGLFISHEIVKRHNGKIWAEGEPGKGSIFSFTVPI